MQIEELGSLDYASMILKGNLESRARKKACETRIFESTINSINLFASTRKDIRSMGGSVGGSGKGSIDQEGNTKAEIEAHISYENKDDREKFSGEVSASGKSDRDGNFSGEVKAEIKYEKSF